ncbi:MAG: hypothetical protein ABW188_07455 [Rhodococcus fascians]
MEPELIAAFAEDGGVLTTRRLLETVTRARLRTLTKRGSIHQAAHGVYVIESPTTRLRLRALEVAYKCRVTACLGTAAELFGFDTEGASDLHIHDPGDKHVKGYRGVFAHQRLGAPVTSLRGQLVTAASWTAVEVARSLARSRALATLDASLAVGACTHADLVSAADAQRGRRGIVAVRPLIDMADGSAQSPMESECRLLFRDAGLPSPTLQHPVLDDWGVPRFYLDFAWKDALLAGEYDGDEFHSSPLAVRRDKARTAWLQERGWLVVPITADDVRRRHRELIARLRHQLTTRRAA